MYVSAVNPPLIREYGGNSLRRVKTDKVDAKKIALYALATKAAQRPDTTGGLSRAMPDDIHIFFMISLRHPACSVDNRTELREHTPMDTVRDRLKTLNRQS